MSIPSRLPTPVPTTRPTGTIDLTLLKSGQVIDAVVIGKTADGLTQLLIGDQVVKAALPETLPPGTNLQLVVKSAGATLTLAIASQKAVEVPVVLPSANVTPPPAPPLPYGFVRGAPGSAATQAAQVSVAIANLAAAPAAVAVSTALPVAPPAVANAAVTAAPAQGAAVAAAPIVPVIANVASVVAAAPVATVSHPGQPVAASAAMGSNLSPEQHGTPSNPMPQPNLAAGDGAAKGAAPIVAQTAAVAATASMPGAPLSAGAAQAAAPGVALAAVPVPPGAAPALAATPMQAALAEMAHVAVERQGSMSGLFSALNAVSGRLSQLPEPVARAAMQLLGARLNVGAQALTGETLKAAISKSGVFLENTALMSNVPSAAAGDIKGGLLQLRGALAAWLGADAEALAGVRRPAPPLRGVPPRAREGAAPALPDGLTLKELGRVLHSHTDAALSRMKLMQMASLPDSGPVARPDAEWRMELPLMLGQELAMAQLQIIRDDGKKNKGRERGWQMRFAVNFNVIGEVGANVSYYDEEISVMLWADDEHTAQVLQEMLPELASSLEARGLDPGTIFCRAGNPTEPRRASGQFVDSIG